MMTRVTWRGTPLTSRSSASDFYSMLSSCDRLYSVATASPKEFIPSTVLGASQGSENLVGDLQRNPAGQVAPKVHLIDPTTELPKLIGRECDEEAADTRRTVSVSCSLPSTSVKTSYSLRRSSSAVEKDKRPIRLSVEVCIEASMTWSWSSDSGSNGGES